MSRALLLSEHDLSSWAGRFATGDVPSRMPYGVEALEGHGVHLVGRDRRWHGAAGRIRDAVEHRGGMPVERALKGLTVRPPVDLVLGLLETQSRAAGLLRRLPWTGYAHAPLVVWSVWLADELRRAGRDERRRLTRGLLGAELVTHLASGETSILVDAGFRPEQLLRLDFGINDAYYTADPTVTRDLPVVAVGQDRGRDYATLLAAAPLIDAPIRVHCRPENLTGLRIPSNVTIAGPIPLPEYRQLLRRAQVVVVPTHDLSYPTGQSVALEAASVGAAVVVTSTAAMREYLDPSAAALVPLGNPDALATAISRLLADVSERHRLGDAAQSLVRRRFSSAAMWGSVAEALAARNLLR